MQARLAGRRLFVCPAVDRATSLQAALAVGHSPHTCYSSMLRVHSLTETSQLPSALMLYEGMLVRLEHKVCAELGLVRGCPCRLIHLVLHPDEPAVDQCPELPPHVLQHLPRGLVLEAADVCWVKDPRLGPARFYLPAQERSWTFHFAKHLPSVASPYTTAATSVRRRQLPVTNVAAMTAYLLQGQTVPPAILDFTYASELSRDMLWTSFFVLLSRVPSLSHVLFLNLPRRDDLRGGMPQHLEAEFQRLERVQRKTLQHLDAELGRYGFEDARRCVLHPLLSTSVVHAPMPHLSP